jgi:hypothetical protein
MIPSWAAMDGARAEEGTTTPLRDTILGQCVYEILVITYKVMLNELIMSKTSAPSQLVLQITM